MTGMEIMDFIPFVLAGIAIIGGLVALFFMIKKGG